MKFKQRNDHVISFRVSDEEREQIQLQAQRGGLTITQLVRKNLNIIGTTQS
jgi:antitoxin component of RelBE/YafQ-DinJ toxin-antitoxin module